MQTNYGNEANPTPDSHSRSQISSTLHRLAKSNPPRTTGPGIQAGHFVKLCQYHNRSVAAELCERLQENGIGIKTRSTRMFVDISIDFENRLEAFRILDDFKESHPDTKPRNYSRDYDLVFLIVFVTAVVGCISFGLSAFNWLFPVATTTSGISLCIVVERWHRNYRYHNGMHFTIKDILGLTFIFGVNCAIWRFVL